MRYSVLLVLCAGIYCIAHCAEHGNVDVKFPQPPQQNAPWVPPASTKLPAKFADAVRPLFLQGFADPRGLEYRDVVLLGVQERNAIHAWVLPERNGDAHRFAVTWNGLIYPVLKLGLPADLRADMESALKAELQTIAELQSRGNLRYYHRRQHSDEPATVAHMTVRASQAALLYRLGETALAERVWDVCNTGANQGGTSLAGIYRSLAEDWAWAQYNQTIAFWLVGDEPAALNAARLLRKSGAQIELELKSRDVPIDANREHPGNFKYLDFLERFVSFADNLERRASHPIGDHDVRELLKRRDGQNRLRAKWPDTATRVAVLIENLDNVNGYQYENPGGITYGHSITSTLIAEGDRAVEPLIECLEHDNRAICSFYFGHGQDPHWIIESVKMAALHALHYILHNYDTERSNLPYYVSGDGRQEAGQFRAFWNSVKGETAQERWWHQLADDKTGPKNWSDALYNLKYRMRGQFDFEEGYPASLRQKTAPRFTELLFKRMHGSIDSGDVEVAVKCAEAVGDWEPAKATESLKELCRAMDEKFGTQDTHDTLRLIGIRLKLGDPTALDRYAQWLSKYNPSNESFGSDVLRSLVVLWKNPAHPALKATSEKMFGDPNSPWLDKKFEWDMAKSWLLGVDAYRKALIIKLSNRSPAGTCDPAQAAYDWKLDPIAPAQEIPVQYRVCDELAHIISFVDGSPRIELYWPEDKRDDAIKQCVEFLNFRAPVLHYRQTPGGPGTQWPMATGIDHDHEEVFPLFTSLNKPASAADVAAQRAIFALDENLPRRVVPLQTPLKAHWLKCPYEAKEIPDRHVWFKRTHEGFVWQLEEVLIDGQWKRFAGYAGAHEFLKLPADELELPLWHYTQLPGGIDICLTPPGVKFSQYDWRQSRDEIIVGIPLKITIDLRNRFLLDLSSYCDWRQGCELKLFRANGEKPRNEDPYSSGTADLDKHDWQAVPPKKPLPLATNPPRTLKPTETARILELDLSEYFDVTTPGVYRISAIFNESMRSDADTRGKPIDCIFHLWPK